MPHQQEPGPEESISDIYRKTARYLSEKAAPLGNAGLGVLMGDPDIHAKCLEMGRVAATGDLQATKAAARNYITVAMEKLAAKD